MKNPIRHLLFMFPIMACLVKGQSVKLFPEPGFVPYTTYYISSIDLQTGATDVLLFGYRLAEESGDYESHEVWAAIEFEMTLVSASLGIERATTVLKVVTDPFLMHADIRVDNRQLSTQTTQIYDLDSPPNEVPLTITMLKSLDIGQFEGLLSSITSTGKLADGQYSFHVIVRSGPSRTSLSVSDEVVETLLVTTPTSLNLIAPGGELADTTENLVYTPYPVFQWETEPCPGCESFIRVGLYDGESHSSVEETIENVTTLPMDQTEGWEPVGMTTTFQYPFSGAIELIPGRVYVWQVKKDLPTTAGTESFISPIYAFKVADMTQQAAVPAEVLHPILQQLMDLMGEDSFNAFFGAGGELSGYAPSGTYVINGIEVSVDAVFSLISQLETQSVSIVNISVE
ncbi:MAG: hypothetical protein ACE5GH_05245 [Fidelibacterota bacterium]